MVVELVQAYLNVVFPCPFSIWLLAWLHERDCFSNRGGCLAAVDWRMSSLLILLDLSATFVNCSEQGLGMTGTTLHWFHCFLSDGTEFTSNRLIHHLGNGSVWCFSRLGAISYVISVCMRLWLKIFGAKHHQHGHETL